jgi:hypothetical protein
MATKYAPFTGAQRVDRPRIQLRPAPRLRIPQPTRPYRQDLSSALDELVSQLEHNPNRWRRRLLQLRKLVLEHRAMGRAAR